MGTPSDRPNLVPPGPLRLAFTAIISLTLIFVIESFFLALLLGVLILILGGLGYHISITGP